MKQHYFELCCEARYLKDIIGLTHKEIEFSQGTFVNASYVRIAKVKGIPLETIIKVGGRRVIERYKQHRELRRDRYAA